MSPNFVQSSTKIQTGAIVSVETATASRPKSANASFGVTGLQFLGFPILRNQHNQNSALHVLELRRQ